MLLPVWGELSYEFGASCLGAFYEDEMTLGEFYVGQGCSAPAQVILGFYCLRDVYCIEPEGIPTQSCQQIRRQFFSLISLSRRFILYTIE